MMCEVKYTYKSPKNNSKLPIQCVLCLKHLPNVNVWYLQAMIKTPAVPECEEQKAVLLPVGEQKLLRQWTPSRRREKDEAEPPLGRRSAHQGSTEQSPASWSPTSYWRLKHTHRKMLKSNQLYLLKGASVQFWSTPVITHSGHGIY